MKRFIAVTLILVTILSLAGCGKSYAPWVDGNAKEIEGEVFVDKIDGLPEDFIRGADVSSLIALENSGVKYYNFDGEEQDLLLTMAGAGFNYVRIRVWNDPYDSAGNGYGGGNCDIENAVAIGKRATEYGMRVLIDFHYSDFWADPKKQMAPKAWESMTIDEKSAAIYEYTAESLRTLKNAGVDVGMVQIGNETTNGFCGEDAWANMAKLMSSASSAVRDFNKKVLIAIHFTNPEGKKYNRFAKLLDVNGVDYDVFATSYYPFWHGTLENLTEQLSNVVELYDKKVMVAETAYAYSIEDFDGDANTIGQTLTYDKVYPFSVQGQADAISDVIAATAAVGENALGVFYWEPAWITVPGDSLEAREEKWEEFGSGWAASYASEYDPKDAGVYYGGSACDNQALFDAGGHPLESLKTFGYVYMGATTDERIDTVENAYISVRLRNPVALPETVEALYNTGETKTVSVTWDNVDLDAMSNGEVATYTVEGTAEGVPVKCFVSMEEENYVENFSFENRDRTMWKIASIAAGVQTDFQEKTTDAKSGSYSLHYWNENAVEFTVEQTVTGLKNGNYSFSLSLQGGDAVNAEMFIYAVSGGELYRTDTAVDGWVNWQTPKIENISVTDGEVTVGAYIKCDGGGWGTLDDFLLNPVE